MSDPVTRNAETITERPRLIRMDGERQRRDRRQRFRASGRHAGGTASACASACRRATRWRSPTSTKGAPVRRYDVVIGYAAGRFARGILGQRDAARHARAAVPRRASDRDAQDARSGRPLEGYTFEGFRNADGSVGTRNLLAITTTVQCVSGVVEHAVRRIRDGAAAEISERRRRRPTRAHLRLRRRHRRARRRHPDPHPAQYQPQSEFRRHHHGRQPRLREAAAGAAAAARRLSRVARRRREDDYDLVTLQDPSHVGFDAMIAFDHADGGAPSASARPAPARNLPGLGSRGRHAMRRQRRVLRRDGQSRRSALPAICWCVPARR